MWVISHMAYKVITLLGGPHWMSKQTALYEIGTAFKKWHPSVGFHMLRGEVLAYNYLAAIIDAINMMQGDLKSNKPEALWTSKI